MKTQTSINIPIPAIKIISNQYSVPNPINETKIQNQFFDKEYLKQSSLTNRISYLTNFSFSPSMLSNSNIQHRHKFSPEEDITLNNLIAINGPRKWDKIALSMPGRTGRQCRDRFQNYLNPSLTNGPWTDEEDKLLEQKVNEIGPHWNKIIKFFNGRSTNNVKNRWYTYIFKKQKNLIDNSNENNNIELNENQNKEKSIYNFLIENNQSNSDNKKEVSVVKLKNTRKIIFPPLSPPKNDIIFPPYFGNINFFNIKI